MNRWVKFAIVVVIAYMVAVLLWKGHIAFYAGGNTGGAG